MTEIERELIDFVFDLNILSSNAFLIGKETTHYLLAGASIYGACIKMLGKLRDKGIKIKSGTYKEIEERTYDRFKLYLQYHPEEIKR